MSHPSWNSGLITSRFVWPNINSDVQKWAHSCLHCQCAKIHRHTTVPLVTFATLDARFDSIWSTSSPAWIDSHDGPRPFQSRRAQQKLWQRHLCRHGSLDLVCLPCCTSGKLSLGTKHIRTTSYHPIANGLVEWFHHQLKTVLKAFPYPDHWADMLP